MDSLLQMKLDILKGILTDIGSAVIAFSGGVDSTFLLAVAAEVLGSNVTAITVTSALHPAWEKAEAELIAKKLGVRHELLAYDIFTNPDIIANTNLRCYYCKRSIFSNLVDYAKKNKINAVMDGTNADDLSQYRPGNRACAELGIISPLAQAKLTKDEIRALSRLYNLPTAAKPAYACLASRLPYGEEINVNKLSMIDRAEAALKETGYEGVRVRLHGKDARIELPVQDMIGFITSGDYVNIVSALKSIGFEFVALDLEGYRSGCFDAKLKG